MDFTQSLSDVVSFQLLEVSVELVENVAFALCPLLCDPYEHLSAPGDCLFCTVLSCSHFAGLLKRESSMAYNVQAKPIS